MKKRKKICLITLFLAGLIFAYCSAFASNEADKGKKNETKTAKIICKVNDKEIYEDELAPRVQTALKKFKKNRHTDSPDLIKHLQRTALDELIGRELIYQASLKLSISNIDEKINNAVREMRKKHQSEEVFENSLKARGLTLSGLRESIKRDIYTEEYLKNKGILDPQVPEADIKDFYEKNKSNFKRKERIRASHILIRVDEKATPEEKEQARKKAEQIRQNLLKEQDFASAVKEYSGCETSSKNSGDLGYIEKGYMPPEFDKAAFGLNKGQISEVVQSKFGYHIIKLVDKSPEGTAPFDEVKKFIGDYLKQGIARQKLAAHTKELKEKAKIEIFLN